MPQTDQSLQINCKSTVFPLLHFIEKKILSILIISALCTVQNTAWFMQVGLEFKQFQHKNTQRVI
jgi:putative effector of murein hydrolase LrgA (UPF0299 family)